MPTSPSTLRETLERETSIPRRDWEQLFDRSGELLDTSIDELQLHLTHPHPLEQYYEKYSAQISGPSGSVFVPPTSRIPVSDNLEVYRVFSEAGFAADFPMFRLAGARARYQLDPRKLRVGVLAAGGNAPGLNSIIDSIVKRHSLLATKAGARKGAKGEIQGLEILGYLGGYPGLARGEFIPLTVRQTDKLASAAGCLLKIQRGETSNERSKKQKISVAAASDEIASELAARIGHDRLDILYVVGGNGTIRSADAIGLALKSTGEPGRRVRIVAGPKTMDNDVNFTDVTFGFRTTVENAVEVIRRVHVEAETCNRVGIVELFGAASGFVALHASYASGDVDYVLIPEVMGDTQELRKVEIDRAVTQLADRYSKKSHAVLVIAEGATAATSEALKEFAHGSHAAKQDAFDGLIAYIKDQFTKRVPGKASPAFFANQPRHLIRSTPPNASDIDLCKQTGKLMVDTALAGFGQCVVSLWHGRFVLVPMSAAVASLKCVNVADYYFLSMAEKYLLSGRSDAPIPSTAPNPELEYELLG